MNPAPLLIIMGTILALLAVQRLLARASTSHHDQLQQKTTAATQTPLPTADALPEITPSSSEAQPRKRGRKLTAELSVSGLDERGMNSLKALIGKKDIAALTTFLAFNRPGFVEIDDYFLHQRRYGNEKDTVSAAQTLPEKLLKPLNDAERKIILEFNPKAVRLISRDLMSRFGGHQFSTYFGHYSARPQSVTLHVPPFDPDRKILEDLAKSGIAQKGRHIPLNARLTVLKMSQLRQMAKDLNLDKKFTRKQEATDTLADIPGAAVLLSMQYVIDDLFMLLPIEEDIVLIKHEWSYLEAYAKMLSTLKL